MKTLIRIASAAVAVAVLGACATPSEPMTSKPYASPGKKQYRYVQDGEYIRHYEKTAQRRNFVHVNWVNPPLKKVAVEDTSE